MADVPKYLLLVEELRTIVDSSPVGALVPSERVLAEHSGVSRMTARRALDALEREGYLTRIVGKGSFVARPAVSVPLRLTSFTDDIRARGQQPSSQVLEAMTMPAGEHAHIFDVDLDVPIVRLSRLRLADGQPLAIERTHLVAARVPGILQHDFTNASLYDLLDREYGIRCDTGTQTIRAAIVRPDDAELLQLDAGSAVLELDRVAIMRGAVIEHTVSTYPGNRFELSAAISPVSAHVAAGALRATT